MKISRALGLFSGVPWVILGNAVYMLSMAALTFFLPRLVSPEDFGTWQVFQFYALYLGYITFGYSDGVLLRLAGRDRRSMPSTELSTGFAYFVLLELAAFSGIVAVAVAMQGWGSALLFTWATLGVVFFIPRVLITFIFQACGNARMVGITTLLERVILLGGFAVFTLLPGLSIDMLMWSDVAGKAVGLAFAAWCARDMVLQLPSFTIRFFRQFIHDCKNGFFVVLSNLSAIGMNGGVRAIAGAAFGTVVFGQLSLALQISTILLVVINSVAAAVFPNVQRRGAQHFAQTYRRLTTVLVRPAALTMPLCWPLAWVLGHWIPDYALAISLMVFLFPTGYFEVKSRGVTAVLMKSLRRERSMFWVNASCALAAMLAVWALSSRVNDLHVVLVPLLLAMALRTWLMDGIVCRHLGLRSWRNTANDATLLLAHLSLFVWPMHPLALSVYVAVIGLNVFLMVRPPSDMDQSASLEVAEVSA